jgi:hypothetical protein
MGGFTIVKSSSGRDVCIKANLQSPCFMVHLLWTARAARRGTIRMETTGEKQSDLVQGRGSKLPKMTIRLFARVGIPLVF